MPKMSSACCKVLLCMFAVTWIFLPQSANGAKPCGKPGDIPHSKVVGSSFNFNDQLRYKCIKGYTLTGPRLRTCGDDGKWSEAPRCEEKVPCGQSLVNVRARIVGGTVSQRGMWPWQIGLYRINRNVPQFFCGGALVSRRWVLTAAHCFYDAQGLFIGNANLYLIKAGDHNLSVNETLQQEIVPERIFVHPRFKPKDKPKNQCSSETTKQQRRRGINLNEDCGLDLVFLFDASVSVNRYYFQTSLEFAKELLTVIGASKRAAKTQVAAVTEAKLEFNLGDSGADTIDKAIKAIDNIMYVGWVSSYIRPFKLVRNKVTPNTRNDSHQVMMFITDGLDLSGSVRREAKYLRDNKHFEVYAIGIGRKVNTRALMSIASVNRDHNHVIPVRRYRNLQEAVQRVVHMNIDYSPCGVSPVDFRARIVGGKMSKRGWWPWQIGLYKNNDEVLPKLELICGGALISRRWILTVASCFYHFNPIFGKYEFKRNTQEYLVKAGDYNLLREEGSHQDINPEKFFVYEDYMDRKFVNDIALIKLKEEVELSPFVRTLCLPEKNEGDLAIPTKHGFATGWGTTQALKPGESPERENRYSTRLQYSAYTIQSDQLCAKRSVIAVNSTVSFCAGDGKGGNDTCHGDAGGAFIREGRRGEDYRWVATGLVSWGVGCAQKDQYGYYTRVYPFTDWIKKTMEENTKADE